MQMTQETAKKKSERTCVGCGRADVPGALLRFVLAGNEVAVDVAASGFGRGSHVHPTLDCLAKACKGGFSRSFKTKVEANVAQLSGEIESAYDRRIQGLVLGARRAGKLAIGQDAACEALAKGASLVVVACDVGSVAKKDSVSRAVAEGHAVVWKAKAALGALFGRDEVGIFAVTELGIASEIKEARSRSEACKVREER
jgi:predicted RNA-binding protein YlxR (DUF448 family)